MKRYLLIDGPNITHASQGAQKLTVGQTEVHAIFGFMRTMRKLLAAFPNSTPVVLWDGASWRSQIFSDYKAIREKNHTASYQRMQKEKDSAKKQMPAIKKGLTLLGVDQVKASNMEADDLAAILGDRFADRGDKIMLVSGDKDWIQLAGGNIAWFDPINDRKVRKPEDMEKAVGIRVTDFRQFVEMKALMGDAGDSVPGVGGVGGKGAQEFMDTYGSWAGFSNACLTGDVDVTKLPKKYRELAENEDKRIAFNFGLKLVDLRHPARPAPINLNVTKGEASQERFEEFCRRLMFASFLKNLDIWLQAFPAFQVPWHEEQAA